MSSILKALQKAEEEKAARRNAGPLAADIGRIRPDRGRKPRWVMLAAMAAVAVVAVLATFTFMGGFSQRKRVAAQTATGNAAPSTQVQPVTVTIPVTTSLPRPDAVAVPSPKERSGPDKSPAAVILPQQHTAYLPAKTPAASAVPVIGSEHARPARQTAVAPPSGQHTATDFKVTGIAWQKESASRIAVVNGASVVQGATVDGARVEEIFPDRVRLTMDNRSFDVPLGKTETEQ